MKGKISAKRKKQRKMAKEKNDSRREGSECEIKQSSRKNFVFHKKTSQSHRIPEAGRDF